MCLSRTITADRISALTGDVIEELSRLWFNIYEPEIVDKNITLLEEHVRTLFVDITNETVKRRDHLQEQVDGRVTDIKTTPQNNNHLSFSLSLSLYLSSSNRHLPLIPSTESFTIKAY